MLVGKNVTLVPCTNDLWHEIHRKYVPDPMMDETPYAYDFERCEKAYNSRVADVTRKYFAILCNGDVIGDIYLKHIKADEKSAEFGIALIDDSVKERGFGTEAIKLLIDYVFQELGLETIFANSVIRNTRSQYVLEKLGFAYKNEDATFKYYKLEKSVCVF